MPEALNSLGKRIVPRKGRFRVLKSRYVLIDKRDPIIISMAQLLRFTRLYF